MNKSLALCNLEHRLKFESGLTIGRHLVDLKLGEHKRRAIVEIGKRGAVSLLLKPNAGDMYSSWLRVRGDKTETDRKSSVIVWGARDPALIKQFEGDAVAVSVEVHQ